MSEKIERKKNAQEIRELRKQQEQELQRELLEKEQERIKQEQELQRELLEKEQERKKHWDNLILYYEDVECINIYRYQVSYSMYRENKELENALIYFLNIVLSIKDTCELPELYDNKINRKIKLIDNIVDFTALQELEKFLAGYTVLKEPWLNKHLPVFNLNDWAFFESTHFDEFKVSLAENCEINNIYHHKYIYQMILVQFIEEEKEQKLLNILKNECNQNKINVPKNCDLTYLIHHLITISYHHVEHLQILDNFNQFLEVAK